MSQELTSLIMSKISLAQFALCWDPRNMELWSAAREEWAYMCVKQTVVLMNHREAGRDGVSQRACPSTGSQTLLETIFPVARLRRPCHGCKEQTSRRSRQRLFHFTAKEKYSAHRRQSWYKHQAFFIIPHTRNNDFLLCAVSICKLHDYNDNGAADRENGKKNIRILGPVDLVSCRMCESPDNFVLK